MTKTLLISVLAIALPSVVFIAGGWLMMEVSGRNAVSRARPELSKGLGMRWKGYTTDEVKDYWALLGEEGQKAEQRVLQIDLVFAIAYCSAIGLSLFVLWTRLGLEYSPLWILLPVVAALLADWTETALQLGQLNLVVTKGLEWVRFGPIRIASVATVVKIWSVVASAVSLLILVVALIVCELRKAS